MHSFPQKLNRRSFTAVGSIGNIFESRGDISVRATHSESTAVVLPSPIPSPITNLCNTTSHVTANWRSHAHSHYQHRIEIKEQILNLLYRLPYLAESSNTTIRAERIEKVLYSRAKSLEEYMDLNTLKKRIRLLVLKELHRRQIYLVQVQTKQSIDKAHLSLQNPENMDKED